MTFSSARFFAPLAAAAVAAAVAGCDCGREVDVYKCHLLSGHTKSCGCLRTDNANKLNRKRYDGTSMGHQEDEGKE